MTYELEELKSAYENVVFSTHGSKATEEQPLGLHEGAKAYFYRSALPVPFRSQAAQNRIRLSPRKQQLIQQLKVDPATSTVRHRFVERFRRAVSVISNLVESRPNKCGGVPVLKGTRFTVSQLLAELADSRALTTISKEFELDKKQVYNLLHGLAVLIDMPVTHETGSSRQEQFRTQAGRFMQHAESRPMLPPPSES